MVLGLNTAIFFATILTGAVASADVIVRVQVMEGQDPAEPTTQPAAVAGNPQEAKTVSTVETLTDAAGRFLARTSVGSQVIELKGSITPLVGSDRNRVRVTFSNRSDLDRQEINTNVELPLNQPRTIGGLHTSAGQSRSIVLTIANEPAK
jgi:hypothetical protein